MAAIAKLNGLAFFPKVAEFCDGTLLEKCDPSTLTRGNFTPLCVYHNTLLIAVVDPWKSAAEEYLSPRFPEFEIIKIVTIKSEISRTIEASSTTGGPTKSELESIDVEDFEESRDLVLRLVGIDQGSEIVIGHLDTRLGRVNSTKLPPGPAIASLHSVVLDTWSVRQSGVPESFLPARSFRT